MISIRRKIETKKMSELNPASKVGAKNALGVARKYKIAVQPVKSGFLKFSHRVDYGLFLVTELAKNLVPAKGSSSHSGAPVSLRAIAEENQMSFFFMQKVAFDLRKAGLITSGRGKNGGYTLAKAANKITLKEILEALEGPLSLMQCLTHDVDEQSCVRENSCDMRDGLGYLNRIILNTLAKTKLSDLFKS